MALSTEARLQTRITLARLKLISDRDRDGSIDTDALSQAWQFADGIIYAFLAGRFGSGIYDWTASTVPLYIQSLYDDIALYQLSRGALQPNPVIDDNYDRAIKQLEEIRDGKRQVVDRDGNLLTVSTSYIPCVVSTEGKNMTFPNDLNSTPPSAMYPDVWQKADDDNSNPHVRG